MQEELIQDAEVIQEPVVETVATEETNNDITPTYNKVLKGDWVLKCGDCGKETVLAPGVEHGLQIVIPVDGETPWTLACSCGKKFELYFTNITENEYTDETSKTEEGDSGIPTITENVDESIEQAN